MTGALTNREEARLKCVLWPLQPQEDESLLGLVARVAEHNVLESAHSIMSQVGQRYPHRTVGAISEEISIEKLARVLKVDVKEVSRRSYVGAEGTDGVTFFGTDLRSTDIETRFRRFSPTSLARSAYHRALWDCRLIPFCVESWELLTDACHRCGTRQRWHSANGLASCDHCNGDLTEVPVAEVPAEMQSTLTIVANLLYPLAGVQAAAMDALPPSLQGLDAGSIVDLLAELLLVVDPTSPHRRRTPGWHNDPPRLVKALHQAGNMILGWPATFVEHLCSSSSGKANGPRDGSLRACSDFIRRLTAPDVGADLAARMQSLIDPWRASGTSEDDLPAGNIDIKTTARRIGRGTQIIAEARRRRQLRTTITIRNGQLVQTLDRSEIEWLSAFVKNRVGPEALAARLGISYYGVEQLVCLGLVPAVSHPFVDAMYDGPQFCEPEVDRFEAQLQARAIPSECLVKPLPLVDLLRTIGGGLRPWGPIFQALIGGAIPMAFADGAGPLSSRLLLDASARTQLAELHFDRSCYPDFAFEPRMSKIDAAASLNVSAPKAEFLDQYRVGTSRGRSHRVLPLEIVEQLAREYISAQEVFARTGLEHWVFGKAMAQAGSPREHPLGWSRAVGEEVASQLAG